MHGNSTQHTAQARSERTGTLSRIDCVCDDSLSLNRARKIDIIQSVFSDHNRIKLKINDKGKTEKFTKANNTFLNIQWVKR